MVPDLAVAGPQAGSISTDLAWGVVRVDLVSSGSRRLEARSFLSDGFGLRQRIEALPAGWERAREIASIWQPSRLKAVEVPAGTGLPFLSAGQVFEASPTVRKWLAASKVPDLPTRFAHEDWILMSRSGIVGRVSSVYPHHLRKVITDDLLRIVPRDPSEYGWLYAYLRTPIFNSIAQSSQYGHMIKHLEVDHVEEMPVIMPSPDIRARIGGLAKRALELRRTALEQFAALDARFLDEVAKADLEGLQREWRTVPASQAFGRRRRLDAQHFNSSAIQADDLVRHRAAGFSTVADSVESVALGNRFKRYFGANGTPYWSASELLDTNAPVTKRVYAGLVDKPERYLLKEGTIIMACSGQVYGLLGRCTMINQDVAGTFGSHDLIRITPDPERMHPGYLLTALNNPVLGQPLVLRHAYGTSIPHLDPVDIREVPLPRLSRDAEEDLGQLALEAVDMAMRANRMENHAIAEAQDVVTRSLDFVTVR